MTDLLESTENGITTLTLNRPERRAIFRFAGWLPEPSPWRNVDVI